MIATLGAGAALVLGVRWLPRPSGAARRASAASHESAFESHPLLRIDASGATTILVNKTEMGQGVWTSLPLILAEELDADWALVTIARAPSGPRYGKAATGGSDSVDSSWLPLRRAGATARVMLLTAAARRWGVDPTSCATRRGAVIHTPSGRRATYGELVGDASRLAVPDGRTVPLKPATEYHLLGTAIPRRDLEVKVHGAATFGIDVRPPGVLFACVERCPYFGGSLRSVDDAAARRLQGVRGTVQLGAVTAPLTRLPARVAVFANSTWAALQGRRALTIAWDPGAARGFSTDALSAACRASVDAEAQVAFRAGHPPLVIEPGARTVEAVYEVPFLAHATMEPMNATADVRDGRATIWAPTQAPDGIIDAVAARLGIPTDAVDVHVTFAGGGFGRRFYADFGVEAAELSAAAGAPVKVTWTREDDIQHDLYRPHRVARLRAVLDDRGLPTSWHTRLIGASWAEYWDPDTTRPWQHDWEGAQPPYAVRNVLIDFVALPSPVPIGAWRAVNNGENGFFMEVFVDELAHRARIDPIAYRLALLGDRPRARRVLEQVRDVSGWSRSAAGRGRGVGLGVAYYDYGGEQGGTQVAMVAEVTADDANVRVERIVCVIDCGLPVSPDTVRAQVEGSVAWAVGATLFGDLTVTGGRAVEGNFDRYRVLRMSEMPAVDVHIMPSTESPSGVGEPAVPPTAPAIVNAVFAATGRRIRRLPLSRTLGPASARPRS